MTGKVDVYQMVTDKMVAALEAGTVPWRKPWNAKNAPRNLEGHVYRGVNTFILGMSEYTSPFWMTYKQATERGGTVKKGEKATTVTLWKTFQVDDDKRPGKKKTVPYLRYFNVFNLEQTEGVKLPKKVAEWSAEGVQHDPIEAAEAVVAGYPNPPKIQQGSDEAWYKVSQDLIKVPSIDQYDEVAEYYSTLFHEFGHSTGHPSRLDRPMGNGFGSHAYGKEELIAEMTCSFLCAEVGIEATFDNSAAYLASWTSKIKGDPKMIVQAAGVAQRAADHILGREKPALVEEKEEVRELVPA